MNVSGVVLNNRMQRGLRLEVSDDVGDLLPQLGVNVAREGVGEGSDDKDIGKGDSLADNEGSLLEDLVEDLKTGDNSLNGSGVGGLGVRDLVGEELVSSRVSEEDLHDISSESRCHSKQ